MSRVWKVYVSLITLLLLIPVGGLVAWRIGLVYQVDGAMAKIRERGEPTSVAELELFYEYPPQEQDATLLWRAAFSQLDRQFSEKRRQLQPICESFPSALEDWPEEQDVKSFLDEYSHVLDKLHEAADLGGAARYPLDNFYPEKRGPWWDHYSYFDAASFLLRTEALLHARQNNPAGVMKSLMAINRLGESLKSKPCGLSQIVRGGKSSQLIEIIGHTLHHVRFSDEQLVELKLILTSVNLCENPKRSIIGDRVLDLMCFDDPSLCECEHVHVETVFPEDKLLYLEYSGRVIAALDLPSQVTLQKCQEIQDEFSNRARGVDRARFMMTILHCPSFNMPTIMYFYNSKRHSAVVLVVHHDFVEIVEGVNGLRVSWGRLPKTRDHDN